jgi:hypothetical protein
MAGLWLAAAAALCMDSGSGATSAQSFKIGRGARPTALGGAYLALADDALAILWNPAGLVQPRDTQVALSHLTWFGDVNDEDICVVQPIYGLGAWGIGATYLYTNDVYRDNWGNAGDTFSVFDFSWQLAYALEITPSFSVGATYKTIRQGYGTHFSMGSGFDAGIQARRFFKLPLSVGLGIFNTGTQVAMGESLSLLPLALKAGFAFNPLDQLTLAAEFEHQPIEFFNKYHFGGEYGWTSNGLKTALRAGYIVGPENHLGGFSGASLGFGLGAGPYQLDYAVVGYGDLGLTHRVTLIYSFGVN